MPKTSDQPPRARAHVVEDKHFDGTETSRTAKSRRAPAAPRDPIRDAVLLDRRQIARLSERAAEASLQLGRPVSLPEYLMLLTQAARPAIEAALPPPPGL
jgi:hypothetical protein